VRRFAALSYPVSLRLNQRYIGALPIPATAKFICVKSPKGTGKSTWLKTLVDAAQDSSYPIPVILLNHRVQLGQALCGNLGLPFVSDLHESIIGKLFGYGLNADSLHPKSQAQFNAENYSDCILILDEVEQLIHHLLFGDTEIRKHRTVVLQQLATLITNILNSEHGKIIALDADLCDISIRFILGLANSNIMPWIVENQWKPEAEAWQVLRYDQPTPKEWLGCLFDEITFADLAILITTQAQKPSSTWSTHNLEKLIAERFPGKRILRIDADTVADKNHPAYGIVNHINEAIGDWDIVLASPTIETGISIDIRGHFQSVWACLWGVSNVDASRQSLARLRDPVPRHIWATTRAVHQIANGETSLYKILKNQELLATQNLKQIRQACETFDPEIGFVQNPTALNTWGRIACIHNAEGAHYRDRLFEKLAEEGHTVVTCLGESDEPKMALYHHLVEFREEESAKKDGGIADAPEVTQTRYEEISRQRVKTPGERDQERKYELQQKYGVPVDVDLVKQDREGWHPKIRLHYFVGIGRAFLRDREQRTIEAMTERTKELWMPTVNRSLISLQIQCLEFLGIPALIRPERANQEYRGTDRDLVDMLRLTRRYRQDIKLLLGINISETEESAIKVLQLILGKLGLKLRCDRQEGGKGQRVRVYQLPDQTDGREEVFAAWLQRDALSRSKSEMHTSPRSNISKVA
jgi:hypothetical protein